ncbi:lipoprotein insertase outer membrane protein LolB [Candidatus Providencia siddallii]|uniref:Outer-membrane lipoprotein LolB n=1 Tax=Candidatus Providencia siddallii TaxID=1715285 RepID=A0ABM9NPU9_9GAMM
MISTIISNKFIFLKIICLLLLSCTSVFNKNVFYKKNIKWDIHKQNLLKLHNYQVRGSLIYSNDKNKIYSKFFFQRQFYPEKYQLFLMNPIGNVEIEFKFEDNFSFLNIKNKGVYVGDDVDYMLIKLIGISIPFNEFVLWLIGLPGSSIDFIFNENNLLKTMRFKKNNKQIEINYIKYNIIKIPYLPSVFELRQGNNFIKFKIDDWVLKKWFWHGHLLAN